MAELKNLRENARTEIDLTDPGHRQGLYELTDTLLEHPALRAQVLADTVDDKAPLEYRLARMLVDSRNWIEKLRRPLRIAVVFAMWGEHHRLKPRSEENPNGEDSLRVKLDQLAWATAGTPVDWKLIAVDDGCPHGSGALARQIATTHPEGQRTQVLDLADALPASQTPLSRLANPEASRKGGAIILGCLEALRDGVDAVIYTDADNSVHLGQIGLLLRPFVEQESPVVLGNRKHPDAVLVKQEGRWGIGIKLLRHMQRRVGEAIFSQGIRDTQAAFKLYDARLLAKILPEARIFGFSFDTDWIAASIARGVRISQVPFAFLDSAAESASISQGPMTTWEMLLKGLAQAVRQHELPYDAEMAAIIDEEIESSADLDLLIHHLPPQLADASDAQLGDPAVMSSAEVRQWIQARKRSG